MSENPFVTKMGVIACSALFAACSVVFGQHGAPSLDRSYNMALYRPEVFNTVDGSTLLHRLPVRSFLDGTHFPVSSQMGQMGVAPVDLPSMNYSGSSEIQHIGVSSRHRADGKDFRSDGKDDISLSQSSPVYYGGEVGVFYGQWSGKYSGDAFGSYMQGGVGTDKFQINAGASYEEWNMRIPHGHR